MGKTNKQQPPNIIISHVYSEDNKGDAALTSVLIDDLRRVYPGAQLTILRLEPTREDSDFESVPERPSFMSYVANKYGNPVLKLLYAVCMIAGTLLWAWWYRRTGRDAYVPAHLREIARLYAAADLVVAVGGGYIRSRPGLLMRWNVPLLLHPLLFASILKIPTVLYSQSVGPFAHDYEQRLVAYVFRRMQLIMMRENTSMQLLADMGVTDNVVRTIDSGFLLQGSADSQKTAPLRARYNIVRDRLLIGVTVRSWLRGQAQYSYEEAVASFLDQAIKKYDAEVVFIPQVTAAKGDDDRQTSKRVYGRMQQQRRAHVITDMPDHRQIKAMYGELDVLVGTRFHSVIFSLTSLVPVIAIEYEHKTSGIMHDLDLEEWIIAIEQVTADKLMALLQQLIARKADYRAQLQERIPLYVEQAKETANLLTQWVQLGTETEKK